MRHPYKLFGFELKVAKRQRADRPVLGEVRFPLDANASLAHVDTRPANDILAQLGDLGFGLAGAVSPR